MKTFHLALALMVLTTVLKANAGTAVICGEAIDTAKIEVEDNYVNGREVAAAAFWSAAIFEGAHLRTTICDLNENRYVIIKKTNQAALDATDTLTMVFPVPSSQRGQRP